MDNNSFWGNNPAILLNKNQIFELFPTSNMNYNQKLNSITRLIILLTFIGFIFSFSLNVLLAGLITIGIIYIYYCLKMKEDNPVSKLYLQSYITILLEKIANDTLKLDVLLRRESSLNDTERAIFTKKKNTLNSLIYYMKMIILLFESPDVSGLFDNIYNSVKTYYTQDHINRIRIRNIFTQNIRFFIRMTIVNKKTYILDNLSMVLNTRGTDIDDNIDTILQYYMHSLVNNLQILLIQ